jgi:hypothetical protein
MMAATMHLGANQAPERAIKNNDGQDAVKNG